jgi:2-keto-4-pentenoate hydratase/2-oxohepta-3-ene-1,7-dioic acid hydratase in catechol pathway
MKIVRVQTEEGIRYGGVEEEGIRVYEGTPLVAWEPTEIMLEFQEAKLLAPIFPTKVLALGRNYVDHAAEMNNPVPERPMIFIKPNTSVIGPEAPVVIPPGSTNVHFEGELVVVIGKLAKRVKAEDVDTVILGYTIGNDVTERDQQRQDGQFTRGKGYDTFCPLGPAIETEFDPLEPVFVETRLNGELRQSGSIQDMVFGVAEQIEFITNIMTLLPGDVIMTGTPAGVGPMGAGDRVEVSIDGIGTLSNPVVAG